MSYAFNNKLKESGNNLILKIYMAGPHFTGQIGRFAPSFQVLGGAAQYSSNVPLNEGNSWAISAGGGVEMRVNSVFGWRILQAEYLSTHLPNSFDNQQN